MSNENRNEAEKIRQAYEDLLDRLAKAVAARLTRMNKDRPTTIISSAKTSEERTKMSL